MEILSRSPTQTRRFGARLAKGLKRKDVVALTGPIGAGKTTFVQGLAQGLKVPPSTVNSPSFVLMKEYEGKIPLYHADLFRLEHLPEAFSVGLEEYYEGKGVTVVEWANRIPGILPAEFLEVQFQVIDPKTRKITIVPNGAAYERRFKP
jgi:tRNA threonylcarbamoyladenosine biosynthesis protein TsaE